jgi:hypothetical protein
MRVIWTSWAHVWRLRSLFLGTGCDNGIQLSPPFQPMLKSQHRSSPRPPHITTDGRPTLINNTSQTQHHEDGKTCMTLVTAWLSITNQVWTQILGMRLRYSIKSCRAMCTLERERGHIGSIWSRVTCLALLLPAAQGLECRAPGDSRSLQRLTVVIENK